MWTSLSLLLPWRYHYLLNLSVTTDVYISLSPQSHIMAASVLTSQDQSQPTLLSVSAISKLVLSQLHYCNSNSLFVDLHNRLVDKLQRSQMNAACTVFWRQKQTTQDTSFNGCLSSLVTRWSDCAILVSMVLPWHTCLTYSHLTIRIIRIISLFSSTPGITEIGNWSCVAINYLCPL